MNPTQTTKVFSRHLVLLSPHHTCETLSSGFRHFLRLMDKISAAHFTDLTHSASAPFPLEESVAARQLCAAGIYAAG